MAGFYQEFIRLVYRQSEAGVLDEPDTTKPAAAEYLYRPASLHRMDTVPAYVYWQACTATQLSGVSSSKTSATGHVGIFDPAL